MISLFNVTKQFGLNGTVAVRDLSLEIKAGEFVVLLGESGCGKTTTLKMINRLVEMTSGRIEVDGKDVLGLASEELRRQIGYVFQGVGLFPHMSVARNIGITPRLLGWNDADIAKRVDELLELVNLNAAEFRDRNPAKLSGGQSQRIGLARALAARPRIMLMDEPFGALDPLTRDTLQDEFTRIHRELELTTVMVTHDMTEALLLADRIAVMHRGEILQIDTPHEILTNPTDGYVRRLMDMPRRQAKRVEALVAK